MQNRDEKGKEVVAYFQDNFYEKDTRKGRRRKEKIAWRRNKGKRLGVGRG
jgi:hypothetical protein